MTNDSKNQIKQMVNFIHQEAQEKVNEIQIRAKNEFNKEKNDHFNALKKAVDAEFEQKTKDLEVQQKVSKSRLSTEARVKKMKSRDELLNDLKKSALEKLSAQTKTPQYSNLLRQLIVQGLIKIQEATVEIQARAEDKALVARVIPEALSEYRKVMSEAGQTVNPKVTISETPLSSKTTTGGVVLTADRGRILVDQTLDERLNIAYADILPSIRYGLFSSTA